MALGIFPNVSPVYGRPRTFPDYTRMAGRGGGPTVQDVRSYKTGVEQRAFFSKAFAPARALTCGMPGMPPCDTGAPISAIAPGPTGFNGLGDLGRVFPIGVGDCAVARRLLDELELLMKDPAFQSLPATTKASASSIFDDLDSYKVAWDCGPAVAELTSTIREVRAQLERQGITPPSPIYNPSTVASSGGNTTLDDVKPLLVAGAVIVGALVLAPVIFEGVAWARAFRPEPRRAR